MCKLSADNDDDDDDDNRHFFVPTSITNCDDDDDEVHVRAAALRGVSHSFIHVDLCDLLCQLDSVVVVVGWFRVTHGNLSFM